MIEKQRRDRVKRVEELHIRRLGAVDVPFVLALMEEVIARLPSQALFAMDDEAYLLAHVEERGEIFGAYRDGALVAYSVLAYPGKCAGNLGPEFGVLEHELDDVAVLDATIVHESARGLGLQRRFHELREQRARERGCHYLYATVHPDNVASVRNLEAEGLTLQFTRPMYGDKLRHCYAKQLDPNMKKSAI
ncbi:GNAT superfamily N-acetyltransferase [Paenibacillus phyllosphaerae]|uniref:GNAT superfamily N-acetyltransferase n=1 Tax=Paenibacillus phyllosphaerae TaxID=274593 RepID=A0A7W5B3W7_9BACL|nr:GNAT family N-acetyltransferase [Paenibacillus phyllosphaerae]MBB3113944.1 GNAT superfamily N-acetyltransferase [Paenibacillus phyllosphaerae]